MATPKTIDATSTPASSAVQSANESRPDEMTASESPRNETPAVEGTSSSHQNDGEHSSQNGLSVPGLSTNNDLTAPKQRSERPTSIVPPFWQHTRQASRLSVASSLGSTGIQLEDNTLEDETTADGYDGGLKSPLWARHVEIDEYVRIEGDIKGVGGYTVWLVRVQKLDGGSEIVLRKRYSEFESLRDNLKATFPHAGSSLPNLPPKSLLYKYRPSFLEKRRIGLKYFMNCVLLNPEFAGCTAVRDFLFD